MKISIEFKNLNGVQQIGGEDLTPEVAIAMLKLAEAVVPSISMFETQYGLGGVHVLNTINVDEIAAPLEPIQCCNHEEPKAPVAPVAQPVTTMPAPVKSILPLREPAPDKGADPYAEDNADYFNTGIKYRQLNGEKTPTYRCRWNCPKCNSSGNHYIYENSKRVFCYECNAALLVDNYGKKVTDRDEHGNYFTANKLDTKFQRA